MKPLFILLTSLAAWITPAHAEPLIQNLWPDSPPGPAAQTQGDERDLTKSEDKLIAGRRRPWVLTKNHRCSSRQTMPANSFVRLSLIAWLCIGGDHSANAVTPSAEPMEIGHTLDQLHSASD